MTQKRNFVNYLLISNHFITGYSTNKVDDRRILLMLHFPEKDKVGCLIKELVGLSSTGFQRSQRNELARALLFKLKTNQISNVSVTEYFDVKRKIIQAKANQNKTKKNIPLFIRDAEIQQKRPLNNHSASSFRYRSRQQKQRVKAQNHGGKHRIVADGRKGLHTGSRYKLEFKSGIFGTAHSAAEDSQSDLETDMTTEDRDDSRSIYDKDDVNVSGINELLKSMPKDGGRKSSTQAHREERRIRQPKANAHKVPREFTEEDFQEDLTDIRLENELQVKRLVDKKNAALTVMQQAKAELTVMQQAAEEKHGELRRAISRLEAQLAAAVQNAESVKRQSEERSKQLQSSVLTQMEALMKENARDRELLMQEHEEKQKNLQDQVIAAERTLEEQIKLTDKLQMELKSKNEQYAELEKQCSDLQSSFEAAKKQRHEVELKLKEQVAAAEELSRTLKNLQDTNRSHEICMAEHDKELHQIRTQNANEVIQLKLEHAETISRLSTAIERLKTEFEDQLRAKENRASAKEQDQLNSEISDMRLRLENTEESRHEIERTHQVETEQLRQKYEEALNQWNQKEQTLLNDNRLLKEKLASFGAKVCPIRLDAQMQTTPSTDDEILLQKIGETFTKQMNSWREDSLSHWVEKVKEEEQQRLRTFYEEAEAVQKKEHEINLSTLRAEHTNRYNQLKKREELLRTQCTRLETELGECKKLLQHELRAEHTNRYNQLKKREELLRTQCTRLETELGECKKLLQHEVETRHQQLNELSVARENERQEWSRMQAEKIAILQEQCENRIKQIRMEQMEDFQTKLNEEVRKKERYLEEHIENLNKKLNSCRTRIDELQSALDQSCLEKDAMQQKMATAHQEELKVLRQRHQQDLWTLREKIASERKRARTAEFKLRERDKIWADLNKLRENQIDHYLPIEVQLHLESTIESLRAQVGLLQKRIALLTGRGNEYGQVDGSISAVQNRRPEIKSEIPNAPQPMSRLHSPKTNSGDHLVDWNELQVDLTPSKGQYSCDLRRSTEVAEGKPVATNRSRGIAI
ncbi:hypothetical protein T265_03202 [Opisthorchis viverrini]|uniref:Uncharacterized protein n=1 Tax=Opisthorchis viverrini TaxID=6198 RepID=A0A074ZWS8_OPIVI|nr:hypothetical protein T265_03202 [Opisthorchis viverrini]KER30367.1 hypothetical protein T265_03202 [Opisthorchis viverrini]